MGQQHMHNVYRVSLYQILRMQPTAYVHVLHLISKSPCYTTDLFGSELCLVVNVTQSTIPSLAPRVEAPVVKDTGTVGGATSCVHYMLVTQGLNQMWYISMLLWKQDGNQRQQNHFHRRHTMYNAHLLNT